MTAYKNTMTPQEIALWEQRAVEGRLFGQPQRVIHGVVKSYWRPVNCRCDSCRAAYNKYNRDRWAKKRAESGESLGV